MFWEHNYCITSTQLMQLSIKDKHNMISARIAFTIRSQQGPWQMPQQPTPFGKIGKTKPWAKLIWTLSRCCLDKSRGRTSAKLCRCLASTVRHCCCWTHALLHSLLTIKSPFYHKFNLEKHERRNFEKKNCKNNYSIIPVQYHFTYRLQYYHQVLR